MTLMVKKMMVFIVNCGENNDDDDDCYDHSNYDDCDGVDDDNDCYDSNYDDCDGVDDGDDDGDDANSYGNVSIMAITW